mmetsp:Transcript_40169/g.46811  ORF Transcript_40169/g.46811 Transcript_40169/m.46811 type:complete len:156 (+) Transcript_40169:31-498(+)
MKPSKTIFSKKLRAILSNVRYSQAMSWTVEENAFILNDPKYISEVILAAEFKGMTYPSFIRLLRYYGFRRTFSGGETGSVYSAPQFSKQSGELTQPSPPPKLFPHERQWGNDTSHIDIQKTQLKDMRVTLRELRNENNSLWMDYHRNCLVSCLEP